MSGFSNFAVSFSIISVLAGCITSYCDRHERRRPDRHLHRLAARRCLRPARRPGDGRDLLRLPDRGWALLLGRAPGPAATSAVWAWYVGWFNFLGEVAVTAAIDYGAAVTWMALAQPRLRRRGHRGLDVRGLPRHHRGCTGCSTPSASTSSSCSPTSAPGGTWSAWRSSSAVLAFVPDQHQTSRGRSSSSRTRTGWDAPFYAFLIGLLMAQYTYTGLRRLRARRRGDASTPPRRHRRASSAACGSRSSPAGCSSSR